LKLDFSKIFRKLSPKANRIYHDKNRLNSLIKEGMKLLFSNKAFADLIDDIKIALQLIKSYYKGEYRAVSKKNIIMIIIGFIYLVNPMDVVPDFLLGGFIDDAAVFAYIIKLIHNELASFTLWKSKLDLNESTIEADEEDYEID